MPKPFPITQYRLTEMARRKITEADVAQVLPAPEQTETVRAGREIYQSRLGMGDPSQIYLLRVFVDVDRHPPDGHCLPHQQDSQVLEK